MLPLIFVLLLGAPQAPSIAPATAPASPVRIAHEAFGRPMEIEVRGLPGDAARAAIQKAFAEVGEMERLTDPVRPDGGLALLNAAAGKGPQPADARLLAILEKARGFCFWSESLYGPLGRDLNALYGVRGAAAEPPAPERLAPAVAYAACNRMAVDAKKGTVELGTGSGFDLWGFAEGAAVDRAVEVLKKQGAGNGFVRIGSVQRGFGPGPGGKGWVVALPLVPGQEESAGDVVLLDRSLATAGQTDQRPAYVNHRTGLPGKGTLAVAVISDLALDAQGLATSMLIAGPREGQLRVGALRPRPSVLWFMGSGTGVPLQVDYHWSRATRN